MTKMLDMINDVRDAVQQEIAWFYDEIPQITNEYEYHQWLDIDEDEYQLKIDVYELIRELFYENMTYHDEPECNNISVDMSDCYLEDYMECLQNIIEDTLWECTEENFKHFGEPWLTYVKPDDILIINIDCMAKLMADNVERMMKDNEWKKLKHMKMTDNIKHYTNSINEIVLEEFLNVADKYDFHIHGAFCH